MRVDTLSYVDSLLISLKVSFPVLALGLAFFSTALRSQSGSKGSTSRDQCGSCCFIVRPIRTNNIHML